VLHSRSIDARGEDACWRGLFSGMRGWCCSAHPIRAAACTESAHIWGWEKLLYARWVSLDNAGELGMCHTVMSCGVLAPCSCSSIISYFQ
jgi:hypothetical protein